MPEIKEKNLIFIFEFDAIKFDESSFYRNCFGKINIKKYNPNETQKGVAAVDILAVNGNTGYLIEIKDYTKPNAKLEIEKLIEVVANKVISTLAAILPMKNNASIPEEKDIAALFSKTNEIRIFLHIEFPPLSKLEQEASSDYQIIQTKLKSKLQYIDENPKVVTTEEADYPWSVKISESTENLI
ncbi:hypothetical protein BAC3_00877 [uncultured bacterium]|nr:hypothetical protein BAC3_00877 [uncultured bacterium]